MLTTKTNYNKLQSTINLLKKNEADYKNLITGLNKEISLKDKLITEQDKSIKLLEIELFLVEVIDSIIDNEPDPYEAFNYNNGED